MEGREEDTKCLEVIPYYKGKEEDNTSHSDKQGIVKWQEMTSQFGKRTSIKMVSSHEEMPNRLPAPTASENICNLGPESI